jgi:hypothetical protein
MFASKSKLDNSVEPKVVVDGYKVAKKSPRFKFKLSKLVVIILVILIAVGIGTGVYFKHFHKSKPRTPYIDPKTGHTVLYENAVPFGENNK